MHACAVRDYLMAWGICPDIFSESVDSLAAICTLFLVRTVNYNASPPRRGVLLFGDCIRRPYHYIIWVSCTATGNGVSS